MPSAKRNGFFDKKVTYRRDVAAERRILQKQALADRKQRLAEKRIEAQEKAARDRDDARELKQFAMEEKKRKAERKKIPSIRSWLKDRRGPPPARCTIVLKRSYGGGADGRLSLLQAGWLLLLSRRVLRRWL